MVFLTSDSTSSEVRVSEPNAFDRVSPVEDPAWQAAWETEDNYWTENFTGRPYALGADYYDRFRPAYRYGFESARSHMGRRWEDAESDLRAGWERYEHRGEHGSTWDEIKEAVRDAWDRVVGASRTPAEDRRPNVRE
jgi:hypothetical protein